MFENKIIITEIATAIYLSGMQGRPIHRDRPTHGIVFNFGCSASYTFEDGKTYVCHSGECIFLPKGSNYTAKRHEYVGQKEFGVYAINFISLSDENMSKPWVMRIKAEGEMLASFSKAARAWIKKENGYYEECLSDLYRIIKQIKKESAAPANGQKTAELLAPAIRYINERYLTEVISISHLAQLCGVSEVYLRRAFQAVYSISPTLYIRNKRIQYAKDLLETNEYSVTDVAMMSGFNDTAYFAREFKKATGIPPSAYRKSE